MIVSSFVATGYAAPPLVNFQGLLTDSTGQAVDDGVYALKFRIYDDSVGGTIVWESSGFVPLQMTNGTFNHLLGSSNTLPDSVFQVDHLWIGVSVDFDPEMAPRTRLAAVPFAYWSSRAQSSVTSLTSIHSDSARFADTASVAHQLSTSATVQRLDFDYVGGTAGIGAPAQVGDTLQIPGGEVTQYVVVKVTLGGHIQGAPCSSFVSIRTVFNGTETTRFADNYLRLTYNTGDVGATTSLEVYYEPNEAERGAGFYVVIYLNASGSSCLGGTQCQLIRSEVFGI